MIPAIVLRFHNSTPLIGFDRARRGRRDLTAHIAAVLVGVESLTKKHIVRARFLRSVPPVKASPWRECLRKLNVQGRGDLSRDNSRYTPHSISAVGCHSLLRLSTENWTFQGAKKAARVCIYRRFVCSLLVTHTMKIRVAFSC